MPHAASPWSNAPRSANPWVRRARFLLACAIPWAVLLLLEVTGFLPHGVNRPAVLFVGPAGWIGGLIAAIGLLAAAWAAGRLTARDHPQRPLVALSLAILIWVMRRGTVDDWLISCNEAVSPPTRGPYLILLIELALCVALFAAAAWIARVGAPGKERNSRKASPADTLPRGLATAGVVALAGGVLLYFLSGPSVERTRWGQVVFSVFFSFAGAAIGGLRFGGARRIEWYWAGVALVGLIALVVAAASPAPRAPYDHLSVLPAWNLVRPLPIELLAAGCVGIYWALRTSEHFLYLETANKE